MRDVRELGFTHYRGVEASVARRFQEATGHVLPSDYVHFLQFREPPNMALSFTFTKSDTGEEWEGVVQEFTEIAPHADDLTDLHKRLVRPQGKVLLPVACDAGGNYLYLDISQSPSPVVDVDFGTGAVSQVARDFGSFPGMLRPCVDG